MSSEDPILLLPPGGEPPTPAPRRLDLGRMEILESLGPFDGVPEGWAPQGEGTWEARDGFLYGAVDNDQLAILRWERQIRGNHAIRYRGAAMKNESESAEDVATNGNLNCIWDYQGSFEDPPWSLTLAGFAGWYAGLSGIELLDDTLGAVVRAVSTPLVLEADRTYDIVAGRFDETRFVFADGKLAMAVEVAPRPLHATVGQLRQGFSRVAVSMWGRPGGALTRIESIEVYRIPDEAVTSSEP